LSECDSDCLSTGYSRGISKQAVSERGRQWGEIQGWIWRLPHFKHRRDDWRK
jgi:hypothetical protein